MSSIDVVNMDILMIMCINRFKNEKNEILSSKKIDKCYVAISNEYSRNGFESAKQYVLTAILN